MSAFSHKDLPKSSAIKTYQAIDGQIYSIGDSLEIGYPKEQNSKRFSYIYNITTELSGNPVSIVKFEVLNKKEKDIGTVGATIGVIVMHEGKMFFVHNFDLAVEYSELIKRTNSNNAIMQSAPENNAYGQNVQNVDTTVNKPKSNRVDATANTQNFEIVVNQQQNNQSGMVTFGTETVPNNTNNQSGVVVFGAETGVNNSYNNNIGLDLQNDFSERRGYGGMVMADIGFDAYSVGLSLGVSMVNGYHFNSNWYVGGGIGILCSAGAWDFTFGIPIFAYGQYTFTSWGKVQPYVSLGAGTNIEFTYFEGGTYFNPAGGVLIKMKNDKQHIKIGVSVPMDFLHVIGMGLQIGYSF